ncbi:hypothetical protein VTJ04DRAFT_10196 [Mycothermus thermophilus]
MQRSLHETIIEVIEVIEAG